VDRDYHRLLSRENVATATPVRFSEKQGETIMNPQDESQDTVQNPAYNPFPEPQTIPSGWDTSVFFSSPQPLATDPSDDLRESESK
jgi:hypothetical protein